MRKLIPLLALIIFTLTAVYADSINVFYENINGFNVKYIAINTRDPEIVITTAVAERFPNCLESWSSFISRLNPDAAINGTYFCPRTSKPVGDIVVENQHYYRGVAGTAFCVLPGNKMTMRLGPNQAKANWQDCQTVICAGPRLLTGGSLSISPRDEGFRDPRVLGSAPRSAIAWDNSGTLFFLTIDQNISLSNLAYVCLKMGASSAMAMDGGNSSGLYAKGRTLSWPGRNLANVLCVYKTRQKFYNYAYGLAPNITIKYPVGFNKPPVMYVKNPSFIAALGNFAAGRPVNYGVPKPLSEMTNHPEYSQTPEIFSSDYNQISEVKTELPVQAIKAVDPMPVVKDNVEMKAPVFDNTTKIKVNEIDNVDVKVATVVTKKTEKPTVNKNADVAEVDVVPVLPVEPNEEDNLIVETNQPLAPVNKLPDVAIKTVNNKIKILKLEAADDTGFARGTFKLDVTIDPDAEVQIVKLFIDGITRDIKSNQSFIKYWNTREYTNALHTIEVVAIKGNQVVAKDILRIQVDN